MAAKKPPKIRREKTPTEMVAGYARESAPLERRGHGGPEQLPSGAEIMALDAEGRAEAAVACFRSLPTSYEGSFGRRIMLGLLATTLLRARLPLDEARLFAMLESAAAAIYPAWGPCDYDRAIVGFLGRRAEAPSPRMKTAIRKLMRRRGTNYAEDRRIESACAKLLER